MQATHWPRLIPALLMLLALVWTGWYFFRVFERANAEQRVIKVLGTEPRDELHARIKDQVALVRQEYGRYGGPVLAMLLAERLALAAWFYPEESPPLLKESITLNRQVFETDAGGLALVDASRQMDFVAYTLAWSYYTAGLFEAFSSWKNEVLARAPGFRSGLLALEASALVLQDQLDDVAGLAAKEVEKRAGAVETAGIVATAYSTIGRFEEAARYAETARITESTDPNVQIALAACAMTQEDFHSASQILRGTLSDHGSDPELQQELLAAVAGAQGALSSEAIRIAQRAASSTRYPRSVTGSQAMALGRLYFLTLNPAWLEQLGRLARDLPEDFAVQAAYAQSLLDADDALRFESARSGRHWRRPAQAAELIAPAAGASQLAQTETQKKIAAVLMARALAHQSIERPELEPHCIHWLKASLGLPCAEDEIPGGVIAPYDSFLLDHCVRELRTKSRSFDTAVHQCVMDFLTNRTKEFAQALSVPLGSFGKVLPQLPLPGRANQIQSCLPNIR